MVGGTGLRRNNRKTKFIKSYKRQEVVESHDRLRSEGTWHIKKKNMAVNVGNLLKDKDNT